MQRELKLTSVPKRIISLVPSITELLHDLGLKDEVVGITKFCVHPKNWCDSKVKVGGTKKIKYNVIQELQPDLIIGNKEENTKEEILELEKHYNVLMTDVNSFQDTLEMINLIGLACDKKTKSNELIDQLSKLGREMVSDKSISAIYLIWNEPFYAVGQKTFINNMMQLAGFKNLITKDRYPEITIENINKLKPQLLLLSTEPYPFGDKHITQLKNSLSITEPVLVDGEMFSWYGSRLLKSFEYFNQLKSDLESK